MNIDYLKGKRVLVTGGAGFLGKYIVKRLEDLNCGSIFVPLKKYYDLVNMESVKKAYQDAKPDIVIHLAALVGGIEANRDYPGQFFYENLMMGVQMMEEGRQRGIEKFIAIGTVCCYPKFTPVPFKEENVWDGYPEETNAPYGIAKKMFLIQSQAYRKQYGFNSIFLMPVNLYGPGDNFDDKSSHVMPALIKRCVKAVKNNEKELVVWGSGRATREFLYVDDCAEAIILATQDYNKPEPVNIGAGFEISIKELVELIAEYTGFKGEIIWDKTKPDGQLRRCLDVSRALNEFGFMAKTDFKEGLKKTIDWYLKNES